MKTKELKKIVEDNGYNFEKLIELIDYIVEKLR